MNRQGNVLNKEQYIGAPIERAHLHRGFNSKKTPIKWIRFFRACVLQREVEEGKKSKKVKKLWIIFFSIFIGSFVMGFLAKLLPFFGIIAMILSISIFPSLIIIGIMHYRTNKKFNKNFTKGFDFFADYFSAFFTLIEEDLQPLSKITLEANLKETEDVENFVKEEEYEGATRGFISGKNDYYERAISKGSCFFNDGSFIAFQFTERMKQRTVEKRSASGKRKTKYKYRSAYPFTIKMKIPKDKYQLNSAINKEQISFVEDDNHYVFKVTRKFDVKKENPDEYNPYEKGSITSFAVDYFSLEVINLINTCYSCVMPRA